jgi:hypothetical protein
MADETKIIKFNCPARSIHDHPYTSILELNGTPLSIAVDLSADIAMIRFLQSSVGCLLLGRASQIYKHRVDDRECGLRFDQGSSARSLTAAKRWWFLTKKAFRRTMIDRCSGRICGVVALDHQLMTLLGHLILLSSSRLCFDIFSTYERIWMSC